MIPLAKPIIIELVLGPYLFLKRNTKELPRVVEAKIIDKDITAMEAAQTLKKAAGSLLTNIEVFDVYTGKGIEENKKSIAYSLSFGANDRTLTDEEINSVLNKIIETAESKLGAELRK